MRRRMAELARPRTVEPACSAAPAASRRRESGGSDLRRDGSDERRDLARERCDRLQVRELDRAGLVGPGGQDDRLRRRARRCARGLDREQRVVDRAEARRAPRSRAAAPRSTAKSRTRYSVGERHQQAADALDDQGVGLRAGRARLRRQDVAGSIPDPGRARRPGAATRGGPKRYGATSSARLRRACRGAQQLVVGQRCAEARRAR